MWHWVGTQHVSPLHFWQAEPVRRARVHSDTPLVARADNSSGRSCMACYFPDGPCLGAGAPPGHCGLGGGVAEPRFQWSPLPPTSCFTSSPMTFLASPNSIHVFSEKYSSLSIPAKPGFLLRLIANTVR